MAGKARSSIVRHLAWFGFGASELDIVPQAGPPLCIPAISCSLNSLPNVDSCCINAPSGHFLQTQFWDTEPALGGPQTWTVHGLWPDLCEGGFDMYCDSSRSLSAESITHILSNASTPGMSQSTGATHPGLLEFMSRHWLSLDSRNSNLWAHEWNKHGTCISTLEPKCYSTTGSETQAEIPALHQDVLDYFAHAVLLYTTLPTYDFFERHGIIPSFDKTYDLEHFQRAVWDSSHGADVTLRCRNHNELSEIWYSFHARGSLREAMDLWWDGNRQWNTWVATNPQSQQVSNCPASGIRYLPKDKKDHNPSPTTTVHSHTASATATHSSGPTAPPFTGKGRLMVKVISDERVMAEDSAQSSLKELRHRISDESKVNTEPIPARYTGCLIRKGTWYVSNSLTSCATFTAHDDVKAAASNSSFDDGDDNYHLFTLASRFAPCSFVQEPLDARKNAYDSVANHEKDDTVLTDERDGVMSPAGTMFFECSQDLPFQSILSNSWGTGDRHSEVSKMLTLGTQHKYEFFAEKIPTKSEQVKLWTDSGWGSRKVKVEIFWEALD